MNEMLYRMIRPLNEGDEVQFVGCYALCWGRDAEPSCGFVEAREEMDALDAAQRRITALEATRTELERQIGVLGNSIMDAHEEARRLGLDPNDDTTPVQWLLAAEQRITALEAQVEAWQLASGLTVPAEEHGGDPGNVTPEHLRQRIAALEAQVVANAQGALQLVDQHRGDLEIAGKANADLREQLAAANLRAERLAGALEFYATPEGQSWPDLAHIRDAGGRARNALAAAPSPTPLAQVREALAFYAGENPDHVVTVDAPEELSPERAEMVRALGGDLRYMRRIIDRGEKARAALALLREMGVKGD